ncbi:MAG: trypsin-like peptidase domain-containing protein [Planctomycetaceae bacterium]
MRYSGWVALAIGLAWSPSQTLAVDPAVIAAERERIQVMSRVAPSVVAIFAGDGNGGGSGVLISPDGYALSNYHVTSGSGNFMKCGLNDGSLNDAVIVGIDPTGDVALIKLLNRQDYPYAVFGDSDRVQVGDWVFAMGNPFLLATDYSPTVTYGIVSGVHRYQYPAGTILEYADCIQVDASINPGNSGGPLFNGRGELIGINGRGSFDKRGRVNSGAGYAISINQIGLFLDALKSGRVVDHATLGATVRTSSDRTVVIDKILENSDAYRRGLREGDEIVSFAGRPVGSVNQFKNALGIFPKGWTVPLVYRREGAKHEIYVMLRGLHRQSELAPRRAPRPGPDEEPEQPPPGEDEQPGQDQPKQDEPRPREKRRAPPSGHPVAEIPEEFRQWFEEKDGFANFHFNKLELDRVWRAMTAYDSWKAVSGRWKLTGKTAAGAEFAATLADQGVGLTIGQTPYFQALDDGADPQDEPPGSGGLLMALHHFRLLLTRGREAFSDFYYLGSEPLDGRGELVDVLVSRKDGIETRWYVRRSQPRLVGFDCQLSADTDPAKIRWLEEGQFAGRLFPAQFQAQSGDRLFATFLVETLEVAAGGTP